MIRVKICITPGALIYGRLSVHATENSQIYEYTSLKVLNYGRAGILSVPRQPFKTMAAKEIYIFYRSATTSISSFLRSVEAK